MKFNILVLIFGVLLLLSIFSVQSVLAVSVPAATDKPILTVLAPSNDDSYSSTGVQFQLTSSEKSLFYYADMDDSSRWIQICSGKSLVCSKQIRLKSGSNHIAIKTVNANGESSEIQEIDFTVQNVKPTIIKTFPASRTLTNGSYFYIQYSAEQLGRVTLYINGEDVGIPLQDCPSGLKKQCNFTLSENALSELDNGYVDYWFGITYGVNELLSKKTSIKLDTTAPVLNNFDYSIKNDKVKFVFDIDEDNFDRITYTETNNCKKAPQTSKGILCTQLNIGRCVATKSFCKGDHEMTITIKDKAGNSDVETEPFTIEDF